jgi:hypothetical protein
MEELSKTRLFAHSAWILEQSMGARSPVGIGICVIPARQASWLVYTTTRFLALIDYSKIPAQIRNLCS